MCFDLSSINHGSGILQTLRTNNAVYHKGCYDKYNDTHYNRLIKKREKQNEEDAKSSPEDIPHKRNKVELGKAVCLFCAGEHSKQNLCAAGEYHSVCEDLLKPQTLLELMEKIATQIRSKLRDTKNEFTGSFNEEVSVPSELMILLNLLMVGSSSNETGFSLPVKTIAQVILYNHKTRNRNSSTTVSGHQRHTAEKESPFLLYIGLKVYAVTRSRIIIDILHAHGLCVSYERIMHVTQGLGEAALQEQEQEQEGAVIPGSLRTGLFTIGAKDNIDKNARCTVSKSHYHGTSLSLFQFPSTLNNGVERNYEKYVKPSSSGSKKIRELPTFYTDFDEVNDPPGTFFSSVSTVNIPDDMTNSTEVLNMAKPKELDWLTYVASLEDFAPDTSWSVYHARKHNSEIVPYLNSILPLLRQNVATFSMQKHCIEISKYVIDLLNPGQMVVDTNDQPVYAHSR